MLKLDRSFYIPQGAVEKTDPESDAVVYLFQNSKGKPAAMGFAGKQQKPAIHYYYGNEEQRQKSVETFFAGRRSLAAYRSERKALRQQPSALKVGDILVASWGYEQTNVDFYEVVATKGERTVVTRKIASEGERTYINGGTCVAVPGKYVGEEETHRATEGTNVKIDDVRHARKWDGRAMSWSDGH